MTEEFDPAIVALDRALTEVKAEIWVGSEPTFTDRFNEAPEWLYEALGGDKEARAQAMLERLLARRPGALVLRTLGRQYRDESLPRWSYGLYQRRDGRPLWDGPPDPLAGGMGCPKAPCQAFAGTLIKALRRQGWRLARVPEPAYESAGGLRLLLRLDGAELAADPARDSRLLRPSVHARAIPLAGLRDELAAEGQLLLLLRHRQLEGLEQPVVELELPAWPEVESFQEFLVLLATAAREAQLPGLLVSGFPPPVDETIAWTTLTPDPAVIEVNQAPAQDLTQFLAYNREVFAAAAEVGLSAYRLHYNGTQSDSGGGGQITLGGRSPSASPFLRHPRLLSRLIRYLTRHPCLSYWFGPEFLGSSSQSPRADEGVRDSFLELGLALERLERSVNLEPDRLWASLSPFLCDPSGNPHRSELNIEKLWNPYLPGRGCLGLVEFRALRMPASPEQATTLAALLRVLCALLMRHDPVPELKDWGDELHERFALPHYLRQDLEQVLADLEAGGLALTEPLGARLLDARLREIGRLEVGGSRFQLTQALEFWPLVGDVASQESGGSRLMDSSSGRIQLLLRPAAESGVDPERWTLSCNGYRLRLRPDRDAEGPVRLIGIRYRRFQPRRGLHPDVPVQAPLQLMLTHPDLPLTILISAHEWRPDQQPYPGLPADRLEAQCRRRERFVYRLLDTPPRSRDAPASAYGPYSFDLRRAEPVE